MAVTSKIRRQGGAAVVTIPPALLALMQAEVGTELALSVAGGKLTARPLPKLRKRYSLAELLRNAEAMQALNAETAWAMEGDAMGREIT